MTDKEKIRELIEKRYEYWKEKEFNFHSIESEIRMSECQHLLLMIDSLQEEPVSENLEEASKNHAVERFRVTRDRELSEKCKWSFKAGAQWREKKDQKELQGHKVYKKGKEAGMRYMKQLMMKDAKSGTVQEDYQIILDDGAYIDLDPLMSLKPSFAVKAGERVKMIIIKQEEE